MKKLLVLSIFMMMALSCNAHREWPYGSAHRKKIEEIKQSKKLFVQSVKNCDYAEFSKAANTLSYTQYFVFEPHEQYSLIFAAAQCSDTKILEDLVKVSKFDPNVRNVAGHSILSRAAWNGNIEVINRLVLVAGADVNGGTTYEQVPPLLAAASNFQVDAVRRLLELGADTQGDGVLRCFLEKLCYFNVFDMKDHQKEIEAIGALLQKAEHQAFKDR